MRNLLSLLVLALCGFLLVGRYVAPGQPDLRAWYLTQACPILDRVSLGICEPLRRPEAGDRI